MQTCLIPVSIRLRLRFWTGATGGGIGFCLKAETRRIWPWPSSICCWSIWLLQAAFRIWCAGTLAIISPLLWSTLGLVLLLSVQGIWTTGGAFRMQVERTGDLAVLAV